MNEKKENKESKALSRWLIIVSVLVVLAVFVVVYLLARPTGGRVPEMPALSLAAEDVAAARTRLETRAASLKVEAYQQSVIDAFYHLNRVEMDSTSNDKLNRLMAEFEQKTEIPGTALKERYVLLGDYLAVEFENRLRRVLKMAQKSSVGQLVKEGGPEVASLVEISGNFLSTLIRMKIVSDQGELLVPADVPQLVFRRRWRMLGGLPYRYQFLPAESLVDNYFVLAHSNPTLIDERLLALRTVKRLDPKFDDVLARAIVYYEGKESQKALAVLENNEEAAGTPEGKGFATYLKNL